MGQVGVSVERSCRETWKSQFSFFFNLTMTTTARREQPGCCRHQVETRVRRAIVNESAWRKLEPDEATKGGTGNFDN